ncbi:MAG: maleate cis-trans isomerase [Candidatus Methanomethylicota archaeon]|nr:MAG: maleate cis-trans isomerase [Candidatus Verstraetearchaeota archaeon]
MKRIGIIIPSSNTTMETEFQKLKPPNITIHTARIRLREVTVKALEEMEKEMIYEAWKLKDADVNLIIYGCTTGSLIKGKEHGIKIEEKILKATGIPAIATSNAVIRTLKQLNMKEIMVATPYIKELNKLERKFLEENEIKVKKIIGMNIKDNLKIGRIKPEETMKFIMKNLIKEIDGIFISCTNLKTIEIIEELEKRIGKPVISSNTATFQNAIKRLMKSRNHMKNGIC